MQKRRIFLAMLLCMLWLTGFAQNDVTGVVKDGTGEPLIGVSVMIKGSTTGTVEVGTFIRTIAVLLHRLPDTGSQCRQHY